MGELSDMTNFQQLALEHLDAAFNLARWLTHRDEDAQDVVQEAYLRATRFYGGFRGGDFKAWLMSIVRNTCYTWLKKNRPAKKPESLDEAIHAVIAPETDQPESFLMQKADVAMVREELETLPVEFREVIVLREFEGMSYKEIADITDVALGTVMSRLSRARKILEDRLKARLRKEVGLGVS